MSHKASISIFRKSIKTDSKVATPIVPDEVFKAAQRVIESKGVELVKSTDGVYLLQYSETGPFKEKISDDWLPVFVMKLQEWSSGGIKKEELDGYLSEIIDLDNANAQSG
jgi:hypothetical protein